MSGVSGCIGSIGQAVPGQNHDTFFYDFAPPGLMIFVAKAIGKFPQSGISLNARNGRMAVIRTCLG